MSLRDEYERYRLGWMMEHGYGLDDLVDGLSETMAEMVGEPTPAFDVRDAFEAWERDRGFGGELYACMDEWAESDGEEAR